MFFIPVRFWSACPCEITAMKHHLSRSQSPQLAANTPPPLFVGFDPAQTTMQAVKAIKWIQIQETNHMSYEFIIIHPGLQSVPPCSHHPFRAPKKEAQGAQRAMSQATTSVDIWAVDVVGFGGFSMFFPQVVVYTYRWIPSGKLTKSYWKWPFVVDFPIENGDFP
jgi:hypothetical protein